MNRMKLICNAKPENEQFLRTSVATFALPLFSKIDEINDIKLAVSEAVTNCIVHAYKDTQEGDIEIFCELSDKMLLIQITDFGNGIENIEKARELYYSTKLDEEYCGMGFSVMDATMDSVEVICPENNGTIVKMTKVHNPSVED